MEKKKRKKDVLKMNIPQVFCVFSNVEDQLLHAI
jgi:hypothetical protein